MKSETKGSLISLILCVAVLAGFGVYSKAHKNSFEKRLEKLGLVPTEIKYFYEDKDGNVYHCVPASGYRQEVIERVTYGQN